MLCLHGMPARFNLELLRPLYLNFVEDAVFLLDRDDFLRVFSIA